MAEVNISERRMTLSRPQIISTSSVSDSVWNATKDNQAMIIQSITQKNKHVNQQK